MRSVVNSLRQGFAALRMLLVFTVILGIVYPLVVLAIGQLPGLQSRADGSIVHRDGRPVGSSLLGQSFTDQDGTPLVQYFQSRPSAGDYDPTASGASNLGPESVVDVLPAPRHPDSETPSLLTEVCSRSLTIGRLEHVSGARPYCTSTGVGAVLAVFYAGPGYHGRLTRVVSVNQECPTVPFVRTYQGVQVSCANYGGDYAAGKIVPIRGDAPSRPVVPSDAVTASGSGLDPDISVAYAHLQEPRIARVRGISVAEVDRVVRDHTTGRALEFMGESAVNVLLVNLELDQRYPYPRR